MLKQIGAMFLILGTCIAAGLLGLPVVTANSHYLMTCVMIISAWVLMSLGAWCLLEVNLWLPPGTNLISMSEATLGKYAKLTTWISTLLLLYSLICAYLAAICDVLHVLLKDIKIPISSPVIAVISAIMVSMIVYRGIHSVDLVNRFFLTTKLLICFILMAIVGQHVHLQQLSLGDTTWHSSAWLTIICAFGYAVILPSIRVYLDSDRQQLMRAIFIGSLIPLIIYLVWVAVIQGALPRFGETGLLAMNGKENTNSMLLMQLITLTHRPIINSLSVVFISVCSITGLLGVAMGLTDFLADGLQRKQNNHNRIFCVALALAPPTFIVILQPSIFTYALTYAGFCCLYILVILPIAMYTAGKLKSFGRNRRAALAFVGATDGRPR